jgi:D-alanine-D-alanine ligase
VLVEEFLAGPEVTVGIAGNGAGTRILGVMEIRPPGRSVLGSIRST